MAYSEEITAKLGLDTNSFKQGLDEAKQHFKKSASEMHQRSGESGSESGKEFARHFADKVGGARELSGALAAALGLNAEKISEKIASAIIGGSAEAWKEVGKLQNDIGDLIEKRLKARMNDTQQILALEKEIAKLQAAKDGPGSQRNILNGGSILSTLLESPMDTFRRASDKSQNNDTAQEAARKAERQKKLLEDQIELEEKQRKGAEDLKQVEEASAEFRAKKLKPEQEILALIDKENEILGSMVGRQVSDEERAKKESDILRIEQSIEEAKAKIQEKQAQAKEKSAHDAEQEVNRRKQIREEVEAEADGAGRLLMLQRDLADATDAVAKAKKDDLNYQDLLNAKVESQLRLVKEVRLQQQDKLTKEAEGARKSSDEDKLSLSELASHDAFETGINSDVRNQSSAAREILDLRAKAEEARKIGNSDESAEFRQKADSMASGLSTLKDSEKTPAAAFKEALKDTNTKLDSIDTILKGKFVSQ